MYVGTELSLGYCDQFLEPILNIENCSVVSVDLFNEIDQARRLDVDYVEK